MRSDATKLAGTCVAAVGVLVLAIQSVGDAASVVSDTGRAISDAAPDRAALLDPATEIRVRALADAATVGVSGVGCDGVVRGSGFVVGDTSYTNRHLVEGGETVKFDQLLDPVVVPVKTMATGLDVATADAVDVPSLEFADHNPEVGAIVFLAGHAGGGDTEVVEGVVHLYGDGATWGVGGTVMLIDAATEPGFSGGPVLDVDGRVVAMLQGVEPTIGLTLAIPVEDLRSWSASGQEATPVRCQR